MLLRASGTHIIVSYSTECKLNTASVLTRVLLQELDADGGLELLRVSNKRTDALRHLLCGAAILVVPIQVRI